jgi:YVTN family beta-propeller protein
MGNLGISILSVIDTSINNVTAMVPLGLNPVAVGQFISPRSVNSSLIILKPASSANNSTVG